MTDNTTFILAGNGPYDNRGCEAIIRGTVKIIREYYDNPTFLCLSHSLPKRKFENQAHKETDEKIIHKPIHNDVKLFSQEMVIRTVLHIFNHNAKKNRIYREMFPEIDSSQAVLSVGGDNYSLDYGIPKLYTALDDIVLRKKKPLIIWGASVGPFDKMPEYEKNMIEHLKQVNGIFARESNTIEYLENKGITENVYSVTDPAFVMDASKPRKNIDIPNIEIEREAIGLNFSPLMANYVTNGDIHNWTKIAANITNTIANQFAVPIYLIPHVTLPYSDDHLFMKNMLQYFDKNENIHLVPPIYNAAETKWIISNMDFFAGARTHSTIASISSCVPTLSLSYSIKAIGINKDVFGHDSYCIYPKEMNSKSIVEKMDKMWNEKTEIKKHLESVIPHLQEKAYLSGAFLKELIK